MVVITNSLILILILFDCRVFIDIGVDYTEKLTFIHDNWFFMK